MTLNTVVTDLNNDVLDLIIGNICSHSYFFSTRTTYWKTYSKRELFAVSLTCRLLRMVTLRFLFQEVVWDNRLGQGIPIGLKVATYVRCVMPQMSSCLPTRVIYKGGFDCEAIRKGRQRRLFLTCCGTCIT